MGCVDPRSLVILDGGEGPDLPRVLLTPRLLHAAGYSVLTTVRTSSWSSTRRRRQVCRSGDRRPSRAAQVGHLFVPFLDVDAVVADVNARNGATATMPVRSLQQLMMTVAQSPEGYFTDERPPPLCWFKIDDGRLSIGIDWSDYGETDAHTDAVTVGSASVAIWPAAIAALVRHLDPALEATVVLPED